MARRYVWWPNIDSDIEEMIKSCVPCRQASKAPDKDYRPWPKTKHSWERIHIDYAGPFRGKMWLVCVDAHSKYPYVSMHDIGKTTTHATLNALEHIFTIEGLPTTIVSDNGTQFTSKEFEEFCDRNGISHVTSPTFHPASNGEAERFVQTFKRSMDKNCEGRKLIDALRTVLASYRCAPHPCLDWKSPAEILHGRQPRTLLSLVLPNAKPSHSETASKPKREFEVGCMVYARNYCNGPKWLPGIIIKKFGRIMYSVRTDRGVWRRHANQLQLRVDNSRTDDKNTTTQTDASEHESKVSPQVSLRENVVALPIQPKVSSRRYPMRIRKQPNWYQA